MAESEAFKIALDALWKIGNTQNWTNERRRQEAQAVLDRIHCVRPMPDDSANSLISATTANYRQATRLGWPCDEVSGIA